MSVLVSQAYPFGVTGVDYDLRHSRILHAGIWGASGTASTTTTTAPNFILAGPQNALTYERWRGNAAGFWIETFAAPKIIDCICIGAHTIFTDGARIEIKATIGGVDTRLYIGTPTSDMAMMLLLGQPVEVTDIRIGLDRAATLGAVKSGLAMALPQRTFSGFTPPTLARRTDLRANISETGEFLGRTVQRRSYEGSAEYTHLEPAWVYNDWKDFMVAAETTPFFYAWRPATDQTAVLCNITSFGDPSYMGVRDYMQVNFQFTAYAHE